MDRGKFLRLTRERGAASPAEIARLLGIGLIAASEMVDPPHGKLFHVSEATARKTLEGLGFPPDNYSELFSSGEIDFDTTRRPPIIKNTSRSRDLEHDIPASAQRSAVIYSGRLCVKCFIELPVAAAPDETLCDNCQ